MATYYISPTGNDTTGNGSSGNPWLTISKAYNSSTPGDTIYLLPGTFNAENVTVQNRTITAASPLTTLVNGGGTQKVLTANLTCAISNISFFGMTYGDTSGVIQINYAGVGNNLTVENCLFYNIAGYMSGNEQCGIISSKYLNGATFTATIRNCLFYKLSGNGSSNGNVFGFPSTSALSTVYFYNNVVHFPVRHTLLLSFIVRIQADIRVTSRTTSSRTTRAALSVSPLIGGGAMIRYLFTNTIASTGHSLTFRLVQITLRVTHCSETLLWTIFVCVRPHRVEMRELHYERTNV